MGTLPALYRSPPRCKVRSSVNMTVPDNAVQYVEFNIQVYDSAGMWNPASPFRITMPTDGLYEVKYAGWWDEDAAQGSRRIEIYRFPEGENISTVASHANVQSSSVRMVGSTEVEFLAGDYIAMAVRPRVAGEPVDFRATSSTPALSARWVAPLT